MEFQLTKCRLGWGSCQWEQEETSRRSHFLKIRMSHCPLLSLYVPSFLVALIWEEDPTPGRGCRFLPTCLCRAPWGREHSEERSCSYGDRDSSPPGNTEWVCVGRDTLHPCSGITAHGQPSDHHPSGSTESTAPGTGHVSPPGHSSSFPDTGIGHPFWGCAQSSESSRTGVLPGHWLQSLRRKMETLKKA